MYLALPFSGSLRNAMFRFASSLQPVLFTEYAVDIVEHGLAHFTDSQTAELSEPLVCFNLIRWIRNSSLHSIAGLTSRHLERPCADLSQSGLFPGLAAVLWHTLSEPVALKSIFNFCSPLPSWAARNVSSLLPAGRTSRGRLRFATPAGHYRNLVQYASSPTEVVEWFTRPRGPFLIPDPGFGADMLCILSCGDVRFLACFHTSHQKLPILRFTSRVRPCNPSQFYKDVRSPCTNVHSSNQIKGQPSSFQVSPDIRLVPSTFITPHVWW